MSVIIFIIFMCILLCESRELMLHRFQSVNNTFLHLHATSRGYTFYDCRLINDNVLLAKCDGFSCWESQLRDTTRMKMLNVFNEFRSTVFQNHYYGRMKNSSPSIIEMEWHWKLELETRHFLEDCPVYRRETDIVINLNTRNTQLKSNNPKNYVSFDCDMVATSFPVQSGSQAELISSLPNILNENWLDDFDKTDKYKRLNSLYVGCSYVLRNNVTTVTASGARVIGAAIGHLSCMFCAPRNMKITKSCPDYTTEALTNAKLCKLITNTTEMPCELNLIKCPLPERSVSWMFTPKTLVGISYENETYQILLKVMQLNSFASEKQEQSYPKYPSVSLVSITPYVIHVDLFDRKYCIILCLAFLLSLTLLCLVLVLIYKSKIML